MRRRSKSEAKGRINRFYHAAKISEYQFKKVLWAFVVDEPVAEAAKRINLSANSITAIYGKIQVFFTDIGVFQDIYQGGNPIEGTSKGEDFEEFEFRLIDFHLNRIKTKRRLKNTAINEVNYNWNESYWRFHYSVLMDSRPSETIHRMMYAHLLAQIQLSGPIGLPPKKRLESLELDSAHVNQRLLWLERNSPKFRDTATRAGLREIRLNMLNGTNIIKNKC